MPKLSILNSHYLSAHCEINLHYTAFQKCSKQVFTDRLINRLLT